MRKENLLKNGLLILFFLTSSLAFSQVTIYSENFSGANGSGAVGPIPTTDLAGVDWTIDISSAQLTDSTDWFQVVNEAFEARDVDGNAIWFTPSIDISGHRNISFKLSAVEDGVMENSDIFITEYKIDEGTWTQAATNGNLKDDFTAQTVSQTGLNGATLQIRVTIKNGADAELHRLDDILVQGTAIASNPTVTFNTSSSSFSETNTDLVTSGIPVTLTNYNSDVTITPSINTNSTAESEDYSIDLTPLTFTSNETLRIPLTVKNDGDVDHEAIVLDFTVTAGTTNTLITRHTVSITDDDMPLVPSIIISEVTDPADVFQGRFVEIYNNGNNAIDLSSQQIHIVFQANGGNLFSRALSGTLPANEVMIIGNSNNLNTNYGFKADEDFGRINGNGNDGFFLYYGGDEVSGTLFDSYGVLNTDGAGETWEYENSRAIRKNPTSVTPNTSWTASEWTILSANLSDCTPGALENEFRFDGDWKPRNISNATTSDDVLISSSVAISSNLSIKNFEVQNTANVTINTGVALIVNGTSSGNITYQSTLPTTNWYVMAAPVASETYDDAWVIDNNIDDTSSSKGNVGIGFYDTTHNNWSYISGNPSVNSSAFITGLGYAIKQDIAGIVSFTGTVNTGNQNTNLKTDGHRFNALGNPYPSFLATANFLNHEDAIGDTQNIWVWNQSLGTKGDFEVKDATSNFVLAPGQGFFVKSDSVGNSNFVFPASDRVLARNTFQKKDQQLTSIELWLQSNDAKNYCTLRYMKGASVDFETGKDGEVFGGIANTFGIYSELIKHNRGKKYQLQSLPNIGFETLIVPIGIVAPASTTLKISANISNLPEGLQVYLEDRAKGTFTVLGNEKYFSITTSNALNKSGRFFLHTTSQVLGSKNYVIKNSVSIFSISKKLFINGLNEQNNTINIYNILGKLVHTELFTASNKTVEVNHLNSGVYIIRIENNAGILSKKIIIK